MTTGLRLKPIDAALCLVGLFGGYCKAKTRHVLPDRRMSLAYIYFDKPGVGYRLKVIASAKDGYTVFVDELPSFMTRSAVEAGRYCDLFLEAGQAPPKPI